MNEKKTPLYDIHVAARGKMVPFAGYLLPVQYSTGVLKEHMAVREKCGLFDVSHMGEFTLEGPEALKDLNHILTNDFTSMQDGQARYSPMCNDNGGCVDDLIVYRHAANDFFIVVNAANIEKDFKWFKDHVGNKVILTDVSNSYAQIALQGPLADNILKKLNVDYPEKYYHANFFVDVRGINCIVSKTGYTGENGYEFYCDTENAVHLWTVLMDAGKSNGIIPCGLGARDTLRLEAAMPLYGHEMDENISPLETGLGFAVKINKQEFIGKEAMEKNMPPKLQRIGLKVTGRGIIREHEDISFEGKIIGHSTSGTFAPYLGYPVAMALVERDTVRENDIVTANVRGKEVEAEVVKLPFYSRKR